VRLETPSNGLRDAADILEMRGLHGTIEPRFFADYRQWSCTDIFSLSPDKIKEINIQNFEDSSRSFTIKVEGKKCSLAFNGKTIENYNKVNMDDYINRYKNVHYNMPNYLLSEQQVDSVRNTPPFIRISLTSVENKTTTVVCHKIKLPEPDYDIFGVPSFYDLNNMWAFLDNGDIVKVQYFVFDKLAVGADFFKMP
jgi:hypothetical protein